VKQSPGQQEGEDEAGLLRKKLSAEKFGVEKD